jgi:hypothetical protein
MEEEHLRSLPATGEGRRRDPVGVPCAGGERRRDLVGGMVVGGGREETRSYWRRKDGGSQRRNRISKTEVFGNVA